MHNEDIKAELRKRHDTVRAFELKRGLRHNAVPDLLRGRWCWETAEAVASELNMTLPLVFPGRGKRRRRLKADSLDIKRRNTSRQRTNGSDVRETLAVTL
jgi:lambda repressor-like predicted transcriptional regulator